MLIRELVLQTAQEKHTHQNWPDLLLYLSEQPDIVKSAGEAFYISETRMITYLCLCTKLLLEAVGG